MLAEAFQEVQRGFLEAAKRHYGARLVSLCIFGSVARGTQTYDSDLDVLIVVEDLPVGRLRRMQEFERVEANLQPLLDRLEKKGCRIELSPVFKTPEEAKRGSALFLDMVEDALILLDRGGFLGAVLERLKERMADLGARRIWRGNAWFWDLKPDLTPGEVFEI